MKVSHTIKKISDEEIEMAPQEILLKREEFEDAKGTIINRNKFCWFFL